MMKRIDDVAVVVLAGGLARRMGGGDKGMRAVGGVPILERVLGTMTPQVGRVVINANGDPNRFAIYGLPVISDVVPGFAGPLAGILSGMEWLAANAPACRWLLSVPSDTPFLPADLAVRLRGAVDTEQAELACTRSAGQTHPVIGLWPVFLAGALRRAVLEEGMRKIDRWTARYRLAVVDFPASPIDPFFNANTPDDIQKAEHLLGLAP